jgi:two-component system chemotaxis response regulator CheY
MRILVVDDSRTMRAIHRSVLKQIGDAEIEEACDGRDAMSKAAAFRPDLILLDGNMPNMDGFTFLKMYRGRGKKTPIIMVATEADKPNIIEAIKAGVNDYVVKPFTPDVLSERIKSTLAKAQSA